MRRAEEGSRRASWRSAVVAYSAVAALVACGGHGFDSHPPLPNLGVTVTDFGAVPVGTTKELNVFLGNGQIGPETYETLQGISVTVEGPDLSLGSSCPVAMPQAYVCMIRVVWAPSAAYVLAGRVSVISNAPASPTTLELHGIAVR
jgi:hypothetical protein